MDYGNRRSEWEKNFFDFLSQNHPDLEELFVGRIFYSPAVGNANVLHVAYNPFHKISKEIRDKMAEVFQQYSAVHPV